MAFRNIIVENPAVISLQKEQLIIRTDSDHSVAIEDISALLLESRQTTITTAALSRLGQCGCAVFICDEKHLPCAVLTPYQQHSRVLSALRMQMDMTEPMKKRLWQGIVKAKIRNQAVCLQLTGHAYYYTIPRTTRELQRYDRNLRLLKYYTIPVRALEL